MALLINDTRNAFTVSASSPKFSVRKGEVAALRSTDLDGSGVVSLYYLAPDGKSLGPCTFDSGTEAGSQLTLTSTRPERIINIPGNYLVEMTTAGASKGLVFVDQ